MVGTLGVIAVCSRSFLMVNSIMTVPQTDTVESGAPPLIILEKTKGGDFVTIKGTQGSPKYNYSSLMLKALLKKAGIGSGGSTPM